MGQKKPKRNLQEWKKQDVMKPKPEVKIVSSKPSAVVSRVVRMDQRRFAAEPDLDWFLRPCIPGEFKDIAQSSEIDLAEVTYTLVKRADSDGEQLRVPMTEKMAQSWRDFARESGVVGQPRET